MRYAVLLSGQPRYFEIGYNHIKKSILDINGPADIFIHAWIDEFSGCEYDCAIWNKGQIDSPKPGDINKILDLYKPKSFIFEKPKTFLQPRDYSSRKGDHAQHIAQSMFWSIKESNRLKSIHELNNCFKYDWVFRLRFDSAFRKDVILSNFNNSGLYLHNNRQTNPGSPKWSYTDQVAFGNSWDMDLYSDIYSFLDRYWLYDGVAYTQEELLGVHLNKNRVNVCPIDMQFGLIRGENAIQWIS